MQKRDVLVEIDYRLHSTLAVGMGAADDDGPTVILQCCRDNFRCRGGKFIDQNNQWPIVGNTIVGIA